MQLVLSLFPGIDLLGRGFSSEGFCVVLGPDTLLDSKIEDFHCPPNRFDGVVGGPPCQNYSDANRNRNPEEGDRLVREYLRTVIEARPQWFLMENVRNVPNVAIEGYQVQRLDLTDIECGGRQRRLRHIQFGSLDGSIIRPVRTERTRSVTPAVLCAYDPNDRHCRRLAAQGAPPLPLRGLTKGARSRVVGNGVPWAMSTTLARAVLNRGPVTQQDCICGCGRVTSAKPDQRQAANASCRKRMERRRRGTYRTIEARSLVTRGIGFQPVD